MFSCTTAQHIYCTNCTVCNWTVLTVITQKLQLLLHFQLHNSTAHLLYKHCTNCTVCNWIILTVITQKLLLHVQLHNSTETVQLMSSEVECRRLFDITSIYTHLSIQKFDPSNNSDNSKRTATTSQPYAIHNYVTVTRLQGGYVAHSSGRMRWRNARMWRNPPWWVGQEVTHWIIASVRYNMPAASALLCHLFSVSTVTEPFQLQ